MMMTVMGWALTWVLWWAVALFIAATMDWMPLAFYLFGTGLGAYLATMRQKQ
jgi:hypothetical protein